MSKVQLNAEETKKPSVFRRISKAFSTVFKGRAEEPEPVFEISAPYNFKHVQHVKTDPHSSTGFSVRGQNFWLAAGVVFISLCSKCNYHMQEYYHGKIMCT